jgi:alpha-ribazole phosphatase/probable phosphoglycerate mutase
VAVGSSDPPLSEEGRKQAAALAGQLAVAELTRVFSSDLARALQTARPIAARHRLPVEAVPALREIDFGAWEGRELSGLWADERDAARAWEEDIRQTPASFSESFDQLERRVLGWWRALPKPAGDIAVVAHRGSLAILSAAITGRSIEDAFAERFQPGSAQPSTIATSNGP